MCVPWEPWVLSDEGQEQQPSLQALRLERRGLPNRKALAALPVSAYRLSFSPPSHKLSVEVFFSLLALRSLSYTRSSLWPRPGLVCPSTASHKALNPKTLNPNNTRPQASGERHVKI